MWTSSISEWDLPSTVDISAVHPNPETGQTFIDSKMGLQIAQKGLETLFIPRLNKLVWPMIHQGRSRYYKDDSADIQKYIIVQSELSTTPDARGMVGQDVGTYTEVLQSSDDETAYKFAKESRWMVPHAE